MNTIWKQRAQENDELINQLATENHLNPLLIKILISRGIDTNEKISSFLSGGIKNLDDISFIHPLQEAADQILEAIENEKRITIYGDYDCDGTIGTAILYNYLLRNGADVNFYIPDRLNEGYGLNQAAIKRLHEEGTGLIVTVDNGIASIDETEYIKSLDMDLVITDHHEPLEKLPKANAIVDFKLIENPYFYNICGAAASYLLILALDEILCDPDLDKDELNQLVAVATVADIVELKNFNRDIVKSALQQMAKEGIKNPGLKTLKETAQVDELTTGKIGFRIAPMINAAGRIGDASSIINLLTSKNQNELNNLAQNLLSLNNDRSKIETEIFKEAVEMIERDHLDNDQVIVLAQDHWHSGVIGIVASKIQEKYFRPVIIISIDNDGIGHASCRSIPGFNIVEALENSSSYLEKFGGHKQAAGFTIKKDNIHPFKNSILDYAKKSELKKYLDKVSYYDLEVNSESIDKNLFDLIEQCAPFGVGNPEPIIKVVSSDINSSRLIGKDKNHSSFKANSINCVYFNHTELEGLNEPGFEFLARLRQNCYNNIQLIVTEDKINPFLNFKAADKLVKESQNRKEFEKNLNGFGKRSLITKKFITAVYKLAVKAHERGFYVDDFIHKAKTTIVDLALVLNILKEAGLLEYKYNDGILTFKILSPEQKANLTATKTYSMLH